ncbi:hypothetical protein [Croceicoccus bisphenolivorans]|uniref:hypothetical protein n=1 Tax=Croceicoccus bisphenolivorans TaxID=1783232 RepID=UPI0008326090|nr:hypothetical protein [Croceicoccus bisphenolivorans]
MAQRPAGERTSEDWRATFLETLAKTSNVSAAARAAKIDAGVVYRARKNDPEFARAWFGALCHGYDMLEMDLLRRLRLGDSDNPAAKRKRKFDNATALRLLTAHRASVGKMRAEEMEADEEDIIASINAKLDMMRERMREAAESEAAIPCLPEPGNIDNEPGEEA